MNGGDLSGGTDATPAPVIGLELVVGLLLALLAGALFGWLGEEVLEGDTQALDEQLRHLVNLHATPTLTEIMRLASVWGAPRRLGVVGAVVAGLFLARGWSRGALLVVVTLAGAGLLDGGLKLFFGRERPDAFFDSYPSPTTFSFPSGHALFATAFFGGLAVLLRARLRQASLRLAVGLAAVSLILLIGFSRIYLGVHYPSDVIGGVAAGTVWVGAVALGDWLAAYRRRRPR
ncbi:MAG: phosphatase PAP2 family protein [Gemmatimonadales bacterium]|nr:phosphatase PAP2 family protein [Gemmatimonadales bacterium]